MTIRVIKGVRPWPADPGFRTGTTVAFAGTLGVLALTLMPPFVGEGFRQVLMAMFSGVCHQLTDRSPHIDQVQLAVCHRCMGIYAGLPTAAVLFGSVGGVWPTGKRIAPLFLGLSVLPMAIDWTGDFLGWWTNTPVVRSLTGAVFGLTAGYFLANAIVDATGRRARRKRLAETNVAQSPGGP